MTRAFVNQERSLKSAVSLKYKTVKMWILILWLCRLYGVEGVIRSPE